MTRQEAIEVLSRYDMNFYDTNGIRIGAATLAEAFEMAIEVLKQENRMTRHEAIETLTASDYFWLRPSEDEAEALNMAIEALRQEPIIRCKDCKHWHEWENGTGSCHRSDMWVGTDLDDYCSFAEPKGGDEE